MESIEPVSLEKAWNEINKLDVALLSIVPLILITLHYLPRNTQQSLYLNNSSPTLFTLYISNFLYGREADIPFLNGLLQYLLTVGTLYPLSIFCKDRSRFINIFIIVLLLFPFGISLFNLLIVNRFYLTGEMRFAGVSGINSALIALLLLYIFHFINKNLTTKLDVSDSPVIFLAVLLVSLPKYLTTFSHKTVVIIVLGSLYIYYLARIILKTRNVGVKDSLNAFKNSNLTPVHLAIFATAIWLTIFSPNILFPPKMIYHSYYINVYSHFGGYITGFIVPYLIWNKLPIIHPDKK